MKGKWICTRPEVETPLFRKKFDTNGAVSARIDISGLGFFALYINGTRISDELFVPALTDYCARDTGSFYYPIHDTLTHRVLYRTYDISYFLREGENSVEVIVGNGWFRQNERTGEGKCSFSDRPVLAFDIVLEKRDGTSECISTDGTEQAYVFPILKSNLFLGEIWDTRLFHRPPEQTEVFLSGFEPDRLEQQTCPPDRVIRRIEPKLIGTENGVSLYDAGENISGWVKLRAQGGSGSRIELRFAEELEEGRLWFSSAGGHCSCASGGKQIQADTFILNGDDQTLCPMFVWHGFRYFDLAAEDGVRIDSATVEVVHTDLPVLSSFRCDRETVNWLYDAYIRSQLTNFHTSVPSDCPHRERLGYTGDGQVCSEAAMLSLGAEAAYRKWIRDILDCQNTENGHIQHTAPFMGGGGGPGGWGCAVVVVPYNFYKIYGDRSILEETWQPMRRWVGYMVSRSEGGLVVREEEKGWCLGDWETPEKVVLPEEYVNTCFLIRCIGMMKEIAAVLGESTDGLCGIEETAKRALWEKYYRDGQYFSGIQGADVFAVWAGLPESEDLPAKIYEKYDALGRFDTGIFGTDLLIGVLFEKGMGELAVRLLAGEDEKVGFYWMKKRGATTLYESLNDEKQSHNHPMFGACVRYLYSGLLGVQPVSYETGYRRVVIRPDLEAGVRRAEGRIHTGAGAFFVSFDLDAGWVRAAAPAGVGAVLEVRGEKHALKDGRIMIKL